MKAYGYRLDVAADIMNRFIEKVQDADFADEPRRLGIWPIM